MKNLRINYLFLIAFGFLLLHTPEQIHAQDTLTMTFDNGKKEPGFSFTLFKWDKKTKAIFPYAANVNMRPVKISKNEGCFNLISFDRRRGGGSEWRVRDNHGREKKFSNRGTITLNWEDITWVNFKMVGQGSNTNSTWDLDNIVYTIPVKIPASKPTLSLNTNNVCPGEPVVLTIDGELNDASKWEVYEGSCGGTLVGSTSGTSLTVNPTSTTSYYVRGVGNCPPPGECSDPITLNVKVLSTPFTSVSASANNICPGEEVLLQPLGGTSGTGAQIKWYTGPNGTGTNIPAVTIPGGGSSGVIKVSPIQTTTYYARREGDCNISADFSYTVLVGNPITSQPDDVSTCIDGNAQFSITADNTIERTYQWFYSENNGTTWIPLENGGTAPRVSGVVSSKINLSNIPASWDGNLFRVTVSADCGLIPSKSVKLSLGTRAVLIEHPESISVCSGSEVSFTASFDNAISLLWQQSTDDGNTWTDMSNSTNVSGVNTSTLTLRNVYTSFSGRRYRLSATNCKTSYSFGGILTVDFSSPYTKVTASKNNPCPGDEVTLTPEGGTDGPGVVTRWYTGPNGTGVQIPNDVLDGIELPSITVSRIRTTTYYVRREMGCNKSKDKKYTLSILPNIIEQPSDVNTCIDGNASFSITFELDQEKTYQWSYSSDNGVTWNDLANGGTAPRVSGAVSSELNMSNIPASWDAYLFRVFTHIERTYARKNCNVTSTSAKLSLGIRPTRVAHPVPVTVCAGDEVSFTASFTDFISLLWQESPDGGTTWTDMSNSTDVSGVNTSTLILRNVPASFSGRRYRLSATNCKTVYSFGGILTVNSAPTVNTHPSDQSTNGGGSASFSASFNNAASVNWVYTVDGGSTWNTLNDGGSSPTISGASTNTLSLSNVPSSWNGREFALLGENAPCSPTYTDRALLEITNTAPVAKCNDIKMEVRNSCIIKIQADQIDDGSFDPDGDPISLSLDIDEFSFGTHAVVLTVSDGELTDQCTAQVIVEDNTPVKALCKDVTIQLDENGQASLTADDINNGSFDNCGISKMMVTVSEFDCSNLGPNTVQLKVTDTSDRSSSCSATVTVEDNMAPVARCKNLDVPIDAQGMASIAALEFDDGSTDNCGSVQFEFSDGSTELNISCAPRPIIKTLHLKDGNGNLSTCIVNIKTVDNIPPTAKCKDITINLDIYGRAKYSISDVDNGSFDNCSLSPFVPTSFSLSCNDIGTFEVTHTVTDRLSGNSDFCTAKITVVDRVTPVALCQDIRVDLDVNGQGIITAHQADNGSSDACGIKSLSLDKTSVTCADQSMTLTVTDNNNNTSTCSANLIFEDNIPPVPDMDMLRNVREQCAVTISQAPTATDNCAGTIIGTTSDPLSYSSQGTHIITWTFDDGNGNTSSQDQTIVIKDVTAPVPDVATLPTITASCEAGLEPPFATDNCAGQIIGSTSDPLYFDKEGNYTVTWVFDDGNGNASSQDQTIVIMSDAAPVPDRQTLPTLRAQCGLTVSSTPTASDGCGGTIVATTSDPLTYNTQGTHIITWIFDDGKGNTVTQTQRVVIRDRQAPVPDRANLPALGGSCSLLITNFPTATDNCAGSVTATTDSPLEYDQEGTYAITWNYEDGNGNTSSQTQWVIISSDAEPIAECKNISVALGSNNQVNIKAEDIDKGSYDECGSVTLLISSAGSSVFSNSLPPAPSMDLYCQNGKVHNLLLSVTNEKGNTSYCQATVFFEGTDTDNDGILDSCDNCPDTYNSDQKDSNNNGTGDACEENANPDPNPGGWGGWSLKKQGSDQAKLITELRAYPNPFQEEVNLSFNLSQEEKTTIEIFNIQGKRVHTLLSEIAPRGEHRILWDGKDQNGQAVPAGIYLIRLRSGKTLINKKVVLQR